MNLPAPIRKFIERASELPSLGPRQATRLAFYLIQAGANDASELGEAVKGLARIKLCERCFFVHDNPNGLCDICRDPRRNQSVVMIVEKETDLMSLEQTGKFGGRYLVLGAIPKTGVLEDWQKLRLQTLKSFIQKEMRPPADSERTSPSASDQTSSFASGQADEIILAFNPNAGGDFNASLVAKELAPLAKKISRLGRGLPTGGEIEFADDETLGSALERRS